MKKDNPTDSNLAGMISINMSKIEGEPSDAMRNYEPKNTLILPTLNLVLFPGVALPVQLGREGSIRATRMAKENSLPMAVVCQRNPDIEHPTLDDLYDFGTLVRVIDVIELPNGIRTAIVEGLAVVKITGPAIPGDRRSDCLRASVESHPIRKGSITKAELKATTDKIKELAAKLSKNPFDDSEALQLPQIDKISDPSELINVLAVHMPLDVEEKQEMLASETLAGRAKLMLDAMLKREEQYELMRDIMQKTRGRMEDVQREAFLRQQMDVIRQEIDGDEADEVDELEERAAAAGMPPEVKERFDREVRKIRRYNPQSPDYAVQYTYLETLLTMPWQDMSVPTDSFQEAERVLERDHYGLRKIKDRILEQIAVILNNPDGHAPIICFVGPPGVGKTSLGQSIASALGREFQRVSLGGLHDEAEIRGHRRTYIGAMPGRIVEAMRRAGTINPVIMLDELDKIGADYKGDPAAALLEVLDPAQNYRFHDNYLDVDYDLSSAMFIATANTLSTISKPLLDRIEVIELTGYTVEEKIEIAVRHIIPRLREKLNVSADVFKITKPVLKQLVELYTSESGVRQLEKLIESLMRKKLLLHMREDGSDSKFSPTLTANELKDMLGPAPYHRDRYEGNNHPGVVTGLAWTSVGGEVLLVEAALAAGKGNLILTGNLGDVMKESATLALEWVKVNADSLGIDVKELKDRDVHIHFPEGAIPKDGPSAGITIATALVSAMTGRLLKPRIAMTGEITLRGKVLPVGGIKEKILAAKRAGIKTIIISKENRANVEDIDAVYLKGLEFVYVETVREVLDAALLGNLVNIGA